MNIRRINYTRENFRDNLLAQLKGKVFHVTSEDNFWSIKEEGIIFQNREGIFPLNTSSEGSLGRKMESICFNDLREISDGNLESSLRKYDFLEPSWFIRYTQESTILELAYLILNKNAWPKIINYKDLKNPYKTYGPNLYVPNTECWIKGDVSLELIAETLLVKIQKKAPTDNQRMYEYHIRNYIQQQKGITDKGTLYNDLGQLLQ